MNKTYPTDYDLIVDAHAHLAYYKNFHIPDNGADGLVRAMDALGIDYICVSSHAAISSDFRLGNDLVHQAMESFPDRILGYCVVNPNFPHEAPGEIRRCIDGFGMRGFKVHPELHGNYPLDGPNYRSMWEFANERGLPILTHTYFAGDSLGRLGDLAAKYPGVPLLVGHSGFDLGLEDAAALARSLPNVYLDLCGQPLSHEGVVPFLVDKAGVDRLLFGSDMPFISGSHQLGALVFSAISREDKTAILGRNAARILRLPPRAS